MKLLDIIPQRIIDRPISKTHWMQDNEATQKLITTDGVVTVKTINGWVTDHRSGSSAADICIPKWATEADRKRGIDPDKYNSIVACHDVFYSGWLSKDLADDLFHQGLRLAGVSSFQAWVALMAVRAAWWAWTDLDSPLKHPYKTNRYFEFVDWDAK